MFTMKEGCSRGKMTRVRSVSCMACVLKYSHITVGTDACRLVELVAIDVGRIVKGAVSLAHWASSALIHKVPVEARKGLMLGTFVLQE